METTVSAADLNEPLSFTGLVGEIAALGPDGQAFVRRFMDDGISGDGRLVRIVASLALLDPEQARAIHAMVAQSSTAPARSPNPKAPQGPANVDTHLATGMATGTKPDGTTVSWPSCRVKSGAPEGTYGPCKDLRCKKAHFRKPQTAKGAENSNI